MSCSHPTATATDGTSIAGFCPRCLITLAIEYTEDTSQLTPGLILIERFRINALVGRGGMGEVYRADDLTLGQVVALKFVPSDAEDLVERLRNEVRLGRQVSHPNVCRLYELLEYEGRYFVVMEFIDGEDLGALMRRVGRLPTTTALNLGREICAGLAASHDRQVVHGDLKPSNVMVDGHGHARITDFGLSSFGSEGDGKVAGTFAYMAPEQFQGKRSTASDIYSLGAVLCELFTGERLQEGGPQRMKRVPSGVREVIENCLANDPALRPASARHVLAAFPGGDLLDAAIAAGDTPSPELVSAAELVQPLDRTTAWFALLAAIGCLAIVTVAKLINPSNIEALATEYNVYLFLLPVLLVAGVLAARRNIRLGRVDSRGAWRIAVWVFICRILSWAFATDHSPSLVEESQLLADILGRSLFSAAQAWLGYMAVEPYIRRRRPQTIIGWRRLLDGRFNDPIVGRDLLIGIAIGAAMALVQSAREPAAISDATVSMVFYFLTRAIFYALFGLFLLVLLRNVFRPRVIGSVIWVLLASTMFARSTSPVDALLAVILACVVLISLKRYGLLATATALFGFLTMTFAPPAVALLLVALAIMAFTLNRRTSPL